MHSVNSVPMQACPFYGIDFPINHPFIAAVRSHCLSPFIYTTLPATSVFLFKLIKPSANYIIFDRISHSPSAWVWPSLIFVLIMINFPSVLFQWLYLYQSLCSYLWRAHEYMVLTRAIWLPYLFSEWLRVNMFSVKLSLSTAAKNLYEPYDSFREWNKSHSMRVHLLILIIVSNNLILITLIVFKHLFWRSDSLLNPKPSCLSLNLLYASVPISLSKHIQFLPISTAYYSPENIVFEFINFILFRSSKMHFQKFGLPHRFPHAPQSSFFSERHSIRWEVWSGEFFPDQIFSY